MWVFGLVGGPSSLQASRALEIKFMVLSGVHGFRDRGFRCSGLRCSGSGLAVEGLGFRV